MKLTNRLLVASALALTACGTPTVAQTRVTPAAAPTTTIAPTTVAPTTTTVPPTTIARIEITQPVVAYQPAVRLNPPTTVDQVDPPVPGLHGLPYAPAGMDRGDRVAYYRAQFALPDVFQRLAWRESNFRNDVRTYCCYGTWQLYISMHLRDGRTGPRMRDECNVYGVSDIYGNLPSQEQKQACATAVLYSIVGLSPWR